MIKFLEENKKASMKPFYIDKETSYPDIVLQFYYQE